jgi:PAS domain S-box-containing protein
MKPGSRRVWAMTVIAALMSATVLLGWVLDSPAMRGLGNPTLALQPLLSFAFLLVVIAMLILLVGRRAAARLFLLLPSALLLLVLAHYTGLLDIGIGRLLFGEAVTRLQVRNDGVPPLGGVSLLTLHIAALFLLSSPKAALRRWAMPLASSTLAATLLLVTFTLTHQIPVGARFVGPSTTSAIPPLLLSAAIIFHGRISDPIQAFAHSPWYMLQRIAPAIIILTILPSLLLLGFREAGMLADSELYYLMALSNLLVVSILLVYVIVRATEQNRRFAARQAELDSILTAVPDALIVTGHDRIIRTFSAAAQRLWGCTAGEACGTRIERLFARTTPEFEAMLDMGSELHTPGSSNVATTTGRRNDGSEFPAEVRVGVARQDGEVVHAAFVRDLSERVSLEDQVTELGLQLMQLSRQNAMGELAGDIAHEINQPLAAASNYASAAAHVLENQNDHAKAVALLKEISAQVLRAGSIIRKLRSFLAHREVELHRENLGEVIRDAANLLLVGSRKLQSSLVVQVPASIPTVYIDRVQIQQVLVNIVRNAFEASEQVGVEPRIVICAREAGEDMVEVEVVDNGPGLPADFAERLGERFASSKGVAGLGIGLNISRRIVEAHRGTLTATNRSEGGASFRFTVPSAKAFTRAETPVPPTPSS